MKIRNNFNMVLCITVILAGLGAAYLVSNLEKRLTALSSFAAESGRRVDVRVKSESNFSARVVGPTTLYLDSRLNVEVVDLSSVRAGDYFDVEIDGAKFNALNLKNIKNKSGQVVAHGSFVRTECGRGSSGDLTIANKGVEAVESLTMDDFRCKYFYRITFTSDDQLDLSLDFVENNVQYSISAFSGVPYQYRVSVKVNDVEISRKEYTMPAYTGRQNKEAAGWKNSNMLIIYTVNKNDDVVGLTQWLENQNAFRQYSDDTDNLRKFEAGDTYTFELPSDSQWRFIAGKGREYKTPACDGAESYDYSRTDGDTNRNGVLLKSLREGCLHYKITELTDNKIVINIVRADRGYLLVWEPFYIMPKNKATLMTYENGMPSADPISIHETITAADGSDKGGRGDFTIGMKYRKIVSDAGGEGILAARGSLDLEILDEFDNPLREKEAVKNRVLAGEKYKIDTPEIPGYEFENLGENSAPIEGEIKKGEQTVVLKYRISRQPQTVNVGENPDPLKHIPDFEKNFPGCKVGYKNAPDTSKVGEFDVILVISCPDKNDREITSRIIMKGVEKPREIASKNDGNVATPNTGFEKFAQENSSLILSIFAGIVIFATIVFAKFGRK